MPELPEVETVRRALSAPLEGKRLTEWTVRDARLRWPVVLPDALRGCELTSLERVAKFLVFRFDGSAFLIAHLGMSGSFRLLEKPPPSAKHDHVDLVFEDVTLRYNDPRRFGSLHYHTGCLRSHFLLKRLGIDAIEDSLDGDYLHARSRGRSVSVKDFLMNGHVLAGVGNIYASEALFTAGIRPTTKAGRISKARYAVLADAVRCTLTDAIEQGGTTLRDFSSTDGKPGYFAQRLQVYGREGEPCAKCSAGIRRLARGRSTFYCAKCQR